MKIVIQCAATKSPDARWWQNANGRRVLFVAHPEVLATPHEEILARPDDDAGDGRSYRDHLNEYNHRGENPFNLAHAWQLYAHPAYQQLVTKFGVANLYILSAGWGLIRSDYRAPLYDITFSQAGGRVKKRLKGDRYHDFVQLEDDDGQEVHFVGGKDYIPLFVKLTEKFENRIVHYNSANQPSAPNCRFQRFATTTRTNWHYELAKALCR